MARQYLVGGSLGAFFVFEDESLLEFQNSGSFVVETSTAPVYGGPQGWLSPLIVPSTWFDNTSTDRAWFDDDWPSEAIVTGPSAVLPSLVTNANTFYVETVAPGAVGLTPTIYNDADTFFVDTVASIYGLTPSLFSDGDSFPAETVTYTYGLSPALYTDDDNFYAETVAPGAVNLAPPLVIDPDSLYAEAITSTFNLTPSLFVDADQIYSATIVPASISLTAPLLTDADTFYSEIVVPGAASIVPSLYSDADTFFSPSIGAGPGNLLPGLYVDADTFQTPSVSPGSVNTAPSLYTDADTFQTTVVQSNAFVLPSLVTSGVFYSPTLGSSYAITAARFVETDSFGATVVVSSLNLGVPLYDNISVYGVPTLTTGSVGIVPQIFIDADGFPSPIITYGVFADRLDNVNDSYSIEVTSVNPLIAPYTPSAAHVFAHDVSTGDVRLYPELLISGALFAPRVHNFTFTTPSGDRIIDLFPLPNVSTVDAASRVITLPANNRNTGV